MVPTRDLHILLSVAQYDTLLRAQITRLHFPEDDDGRITRKRLRVLTDLGLLNHTFMRTVNPAVNAGVSAPVYFISAQGAEFVAQETGENSYKLCNTTTPHHLYLYHFIAVAETHMLLDRACALLGNVNVADWIGERTIANPAERDPSRRYRLYTKIDEKVCCVPDAGFLLQKDDFAKVFYLEQDRDTTKSAERVAAQKCQGYAAMFDQKLHYRHFPAATWDKFNVLMIAPTPRRRDALRAAISKRPHGNIWKFASLTELSAATFLTEPVWHQGDAENPRSLLLKEAP